MGVHAWRRVITVALAAAALAGCAVPPLLEGEIAITAPAAMAQESLPLDVRWTPADDRYGRVRYAVFVDRDPIAPGASLRVLAEAEDDRACLANASCPDDVWLAARGVHLVERPHFSLDVIAEEAGAIGEAQELHTIAVVLTRDGRRVGDAGAMTEFALVRDSASRTAEGSNGG